MARSDLPVIELPVVRVAPRIAVRPYESSPTFRLECETFSVYLGGYTVTDYIQGKYAAGQELLPSASKALEPIDRLLLAVARRGRVGIRMADMYARFFRPGAVLRQKLVLLLAIHESCAPHHRELNSAIIGNPYRILLRVVGEATLSVVALAVGIVTIGLPHVILRVVRRSPNAESEPS